MSKATTLGRHLPTNNNDELGESIHHSLASSTPQFKPSQARLPLPAKFWWKCSAGKIQRKDQQARKRFSDSQSCRLVGAKHQVSRTQRDYMARNEPMLAKHVKKHSELTSATYSPMASLVCWFGMSCPVDMCMLTPQSCRLSFDRGTLV